MSSKALFLDRDGVINHEVGYLYRPDQVTFVDGIFALVRTAQHHGYKVVVVTNQSGIARGMYTVDDFNKLMQWMRAEFVREGASLDAVYFCPYHPEHGQGEYRREHEDRKPGPGMLLRAARDLDLDLSQSLLVGDRCSDIQAAHAAGLHHAFLLGGTEEVSCRFVHQLLTTLDEAAAWIAADSHMMTSS